MKSRLPKMPLVLCLLCTVTQLWTVKANVEKTIFLGPSPVALPNAHPGLDDLRLDVLDPARSLILATQLAVQFPTAPAPRGLESWYLLRGLEDGRRYEVRICWPATVSLYLFLHNCACCARRRRPLLSCRVFVCLRQQMLTPSSATHRLLGRRVPAHSRLRHTRPHILPRPLQRAASKAQSARHRRFGRRPRPVYTIPTHTGRRIILFDESYVDGTSPSRGCRY